jgi:prevent-host-death family protein
MKCQWQLQIAKARLCEVLRAAQEHGPQHISVRGEPAAVLLSEADFRRLQSPRPRFAEFIRRSPLTGCRLSITRDRSGTRDVDL